MLFLGYFSQVWKFSASAEFYLSETLLLRELNILDSDIIDNPILRSLINLIPGEDENFPGNTSETYSVNGC